MSRKIEDQFTHDELEFAYSLINSNPMTSKELYANCNDSKDDFTRSDKSLRLLAFRMHLAVHGVVPEGCSDDPSWYKVSTNIKDYVFGYGIDAHFNVSEACRKRGIPVKRMEKTKATKLFLEYAKAGMFQQNYYQWETLKVFRERIVQNIRSGASVETAVKQIVEH